MGNLVETTIFAQWMHDENFTPYYAQWNGGEVDIVGLSQRDLKPVWAVEIKWSNRYFEKPTDLKSLLKFLSENNLKFIPIVTSIDQEGYKNLSDNKLLFVTAARYAYTISKKTLDGKIANIE